MKNHETSILNANNNSFSGPLIIGSFEKRPPGHGLGYVCLLIKKKEKKLHVKLWLIPYVTDGHIFGKLVFSSKVTCGTIFLESNLEGSRPVDLYFSSIKHIATISFLTTRDTVLIYMQQFLSCRPFHPPGKLPAICNNSLATRDPSA